MLAQINSKLELIRLGVFFVYLFVFCEDILGVTRDTSIFREPLALLTEKRGRGSNSTLIILGSCPGLKQLGSIGKICRWFIAASFLGFGQVERKRGRVCLGPQKLILMLKKLVG